MGRRVIVIGGGNTAIDIAVQMKKLGAEFVTMVYRRGFSEMGATDFEQEIAQTNGVMIKTWATPKRILTDDDHVTGVRFEYTENDERGRLSARLSSGAGPPGMSAARRAASRSLSAARKRRARPQRTPWRPPRRLAR